MLHHKLRLPGALLAAALAAGCADDLPPTASGADARGAEASAQAAGRDRYIVKLRPGVADVRGVSRRLTAHPGAQLGHVYEHALRGFSATLPPGVLARVRAAPEVEAVAPVQEVRLAQQAAPWNLDRIDQRDLPLNSVYNYKATGRGVNIYVIDTGIYTAHPEFGGRARVAFDAFGENGQDCEGHGTHVAGIAGGATYGVAKEATLHAVRVFSCTQPTTTEHVVNGVNWVAANRQLPAVANLSLESNPDAMLDAAVRGLRNAGVTVVVAAGNRWPPNDTTVDACTRTPARVAEVITVSATSNTDARAYFANYGPCVDVFAPGLNVPSADLVDPDNPRVGPGGDECIRDPKAEDSVCQTGGGIVPAAVQPTHGERSGTSMAAPHVAGVAALQLQDHPTLSPDSVASLIRLHATPGKVTSEGAGSPRLLLYSGFVTRVYTTIGTHITAGYVGAYQYLDAYDSGAYVTAEATSTSGMAARMVIEDLNGGTLNSGDPVAIRALNAPGEAYVRYSAGNTRGSLLEATSPTVCTSCQFIIERVQKSATGSWSVVTGPVQTGTRYPVSFRRPGSTQRWYADVDWVVVGLSGLSDRAAWWLSTVER